MFTDEQKTMLAAPLDRKNIKPAPQGKYGEYVDGHHVISEANRIFDFGWSYTITSLAQCSRVEANNGDQIRIGYRCTVRVMVGDIAREGAAVGVGIGKPANEADVHESAVKEAETDALKRALRSFGNTFGLALYDKSDERAVADTPPPVLTSSQHDELSLLCQGASFDPGRFVSRYNSDNNANVPNLKGMPQSEYEPMKTALQKIIANRSAAQKENA